MRFEQKSLRHQLVQLADLVSQCDWIYRDDGFFQRIHNFLLLFLRKIVEIVWNARVDLLLTVSCGIAQDFLAFVPHSLQASPRGSDAGGEPPLEHCHREPNRSATG